MLCDDPYKCPVFPEIHTDHLSSATYAYCNFFFDFPFSLNAFICFNYGSE